MRKPNLWKCETCNGWFDLGPVASRGLLIRATECACPSPNLQQRIKPPSAIERALQECERVLAAFDRAQEIGYPAPLRITASSKKPSGLIASAERLF
jgi:hypothetical protein